MTILKLDISSVIRTILNSRANAYISNIDIGRNNFFDLLNACAKLGLLDIVTSMVEGNNPLKG